MCIKKPITSITSIDELLDDVDIRENIDLINLKPKDILKLKIIYIAQHNSGYIHYKPKLVGLIEKNIDSWNFWDIFLSSERICYILTFKRYDVDTEIPLMSKEMYKKLKQIKLEDIELILLKQYIQSVYDIETVDIDLLKYHKKIRKIRHQFNHEGYDLPHELYRSMINCTFEQSLKEHYPRLFED